MKDNPITPGAYRPSNLGRKLLVGGVLLLGAVGYLAYAGMKQGWVYYVSVDQLAAADGAQRTSRVRLMGTVATEGMEVNGGRMTAQFVLVGQDPAKRVAVSYRGSVPDLFKAGADVVVEGKLNPAGDRFEADVLLTKCASKYDAKHPGNKGTDAKDRTAMARLEKAS
jgi:cytochrome c-type biogenesis protein CcmE